MPPLRSTAEKPKRPLFRESQLTIEQRRYGILREEVATRSSPQAVAAGAEALHMVRPSQVTVLHVPAAVQAPESLALAQRKQAEFENFRKRAAREAALASDRGMAKLAKELLPALDHLELALKAAEGHEDVVKGFHMVAGELRAALERVGIQPFSPKGEPFDPNEHEAMAQQPVEGAESGTVVEVYQSGYRINGAVLRPARVVVAA